MKTSAAAFLALVIASASAFGEQQAAIASLK
jgi:hypothetical protein